MTAKWQLPAKVIGTTALALLLQSCITYSDYPMTTILFSDHTECSPSASHSIKIGKEYMTPYLVATVNGVPLRLEIDTGASISSIKPSALQKIGLRVADGEHYRTMLNGAPYDTRLFKTEFSTGDFRVEGKPFILQDDPPPPPGSLSQTAGLDGLVGMDFFGAAPTDFNFGDNLVTVYSPMCSPRTRLASDSSWQAVERVVRPKGPRGTIHCNVTLSGRSVGAVIDSGATSEIIPISIASLFGITAETLKSIGPISGSIQTFNDGTKLVYSTKFKNLSFAGNSIDDGDASISPDEDNLHELLIGMDVLGQIEFFVEPDSRLVYFHSKGSLTQKLYAD